jgi:hypothetical protein
VAGVGGNSDPARALRRRSDRDSGRWKRTGVRGSFINLVGSGRTCGAYVLEIPPRSETQPQRDLFARPALFSPITAGEHLETKRKENIRSGYEN